MSMHVNLIPHCINRCLEHVADVPEGRHKTAALACLRVVQYDSVILVDLVDPDDSMVGVDTSDCVTSTRPRLLRYHYPLVSLHPLEKKHLLSILAEDMNKAEIFGIRDWHDHLHSYGSREKLIPLEIFDWVNVSNPCLITYEKDEKGIDRTSHRGYPTSVDLEHFFPAYIHESSDIGSSASVRRG